MVRQANEQEDNCFDLPWLQLHIGCAVTQVKLIVFLLNMVLQYEPERIIERKCRELDLAICDDHLLQ